MFLSVTDSGYTVEVTGNGFWLSTGKSCVSDCAYNNKRYLVTLIGHEAIAVYKNNAGLFDLVYSNMTKHVLVIIVLLLTSMLRFFQDGAVVTETVYLDFVNDGTGPLDDFQKAALPETFHNLTLFYFVPDAHFNISSLDHLAAEVLIPT